MVYVQVYNSMTLATTTLSVTLACTVMRGDDVWERRPLGRDAQVIRSVEDMDCVYLKLLSQHMVSVWRCSQLLRVLQCTHSIWQTWLILVRVHMPTREILRKCAGRDTLIRLQVDVLQDCNQRIRYVLLSYKKVI